MTYHETKSGVLYCGDVLATLRSLPDEIVNCCVTSPPYWGLRDYGTATWVGGSAECDHRGKPFATKANVNRNTNGSNDTKNQEDREFYKEQCPKCGAIRKDQQLGLEKTPEEYVARMVDVFREVRRVLRKDGVMFLNLGDSYAGGGRGFGYGGKQDTNKGCDGMPVSIVPKGLKPKDLVGIPWMLAFALRADGWWLRQDIIWAKPNPMPESVKDRCTKSHEYIFLLSKSAKYYYDNEAVMEVATGFDGRKDTMFKGAVKSYDGVMPGGKPQSFAQNGHERWQYKSLETGRTGEVHSGYENPDGSLRVSFDDKGVPVRNKRDVWTVTTKPYKGAHYATFNPELIKPCILAGAPEGGIVFDPFVGSGTTVATAIQLGRKGIGIDLSFKYLQENAKARVESAELPLLNFIEQ